MVMSFSVTTLTAPTTALKETRYSAIEDAITGANFMLADGAASVWIVNSISPDGLDCKFVSEFRIDCEEGIVCTICLQSTSRLASLI